MFDFLSISKNVEMGNAPKTSELVHTAIENNEDVNKVLQALLAGLSSIGEKFSRNEVYIPQVLIAARALNRGLDIVKPLLEGNNSGVAPVKAVIGTVEGDQHDIGKNLVRMMLVGEGFEVVDLGVDVPASKFVEEAVKENAKFIVLSALLTTTMGKMKEVIDLLNEMGIRQQFTVMVGGAPVSQEFADEIGADIYTADAASAARSAKAIA